MLTSESSILKRANAMSSKMTKCRSTVDLRENEKPVLRELGGYKFYQKPAETVTTSKNKKTNSYRSGSDTDLASLRKTIEQQKETIANREIYVLQLEKNISASEVESAKSKKQIETLRASIEDYSSTLDYLRHEQETLTSEKDRLNFTLLTYENELKELRTSNVALATEYEHSEQSRIIAVGHIHEIENFPEKVCGSGAVINSHKCVKHSPKFLEKLGSVKECIEKLRAERDSLQIAQKDLSSFFQENLQVFVDRVGELQKRDGKWFREGNGAEEVMEQLSEGNKDKEKNEPNSLETFEETENERDKEMDLVQFKTKLKSNEDMIDQLANEIRDLENKKKGLLESRFAMIQKFQARQEYMDEDLEEEDEEADEEKETDEGTSEYDETLEELEEREKAKRKGSYRVTRKIRKLERTLSMNRGVGKLDCIQTLCKKLEDCEQKVQELEAINKDLREENDDMEEEAKYLKYVLSYRGDTLKAQLEQEYQAKMAELDEELRVAKETSAGVSEHKELTERNQALEDEVQRLHEELKSLLLSLPALQGDENQRSSIVQDNDTLRRIGDNEEVVRNLEEKVRQLNEEKQMLLLSMQTLTSQCAADEPGNNTSFSQSLVVMEKTLRDVESENAYFLETFQRIREVLEVDDEERDDGEHVDSFKISKLKGEIQRLSEKADTRRSYGEESRKGEDVKEVCVKHEERLSELGKEVVRLHEEKKSLLSTIIRLQADPNFTFTDNVTGDELGGQSALASPGKELLAGDDVDNFISVSQRTNIMASSPLPPKYNRDKEVQIGMPCDNFGGLLGNLQQDLETLKAALDQQGILDAKVEKKPRESAVSHSLIQQENIPEEIDELRRRVDEFEEQNRILQENLEESEAIRSDLHRTISIATDMATEERLKSADLIKTKTALEKDMIKLAKDNQDLRDGLETLSRVRKRRNSRVQYMSHASPASPGSEGACDNDGASLYLPLLRRQTRCSESEMSDVDVSIVDSKS